MKSFAATIWDLLGQVQALTLSATTKDRRSFFHNATAAGSVAVSRTGSRLIIFHEAGVWTSVERQTNDFRNAYRWSLTESADAIGLAHLRHGLDHPVHLVDFRPLGNGGMYSLKPHICGADHYSARLCAAGDRIYLHWTIQGPLKNDTIACTYLTGKMHRERQNDN